MPVVARRCRKWIKPVGLCSIVNGVVGRADGANQLTWAVCWAISMPTKSSAGVRAGIIGVGF